MELTFVEDPSSDGDGDNTDETGAQESITVLTSDAALTAADTMAAAPTLYVDPAATPREEHPPPPAQSRSWIESCSRHDDSCTDWWRSSAGGISGVVNVILATFIVVYAATLAAWPDVVSAIAAAENPSAMLLVPPFLQTVEAKEAVIAICGVLFLFALWVIRRVTCARRSTLRDFEATANERQHSKWRVVRMYECVKETKGPGSAIWIEITLAKEVVETGLQIINLVDYAGHGYSATALYLCKVTACTSPSPQPPPFALRTLHP